MVMVNKREIYKTFQEEFNGVFMIDGVKVKKLKVIPDERGWLMEILRCDDEIYKEFGQVTGLHDHRLSRSGEGLAFP